MPNLRESFNPGALGLKPTEIGVDARAAAARRIAMFSNQVGGATEQLAGETRRLGSEEQGLGRETEKLGSETGQVGEAQGRALAVVGRGIGSGIHAAGDAAVKYLDHQQISHGALALAGLMQQKTQAWNDAAKNADPNDPTVAQDFLANNLEPDLETFKQSFWSEGARQWAESRVDAFRQHMFAKTSADMSTLAGQAAAVNHRQTVNALSSTVRSDPSSLDFSLSTLESMTDAKLGTSPNLSAESAGRMRGELLQGGKEAIVKSAAIGEIEKTGQVPEWVTDPKYAPYVNGAELKQFANAAKYYNQVSKNEDRSARIQRDYEAKTDFNTKINELEAATMPQSVGDRPKLPDDYWDKLRELSKHPGAALEPGRLKTMVTSGQIITERLNKPEPLTRISHESTVGLLRRIRAGDETRLGDNTAIYDAYDAGKLSTSDFNFLIREFGNLRTPEGAALEKDRSTFLKQYAKVIDGNMNQTGQHSLLGTQRMYEFEMDARRQEGYLRSKGLDPHLVYDPRSEHFWGRPENLAKYHVSLQEAQAYEKTQATADRANANAPPAPKVGDRKQFKQGWGRWNGTGWDPE